MTESADVALTSPALLQWVQAFSFVKPLRCFKCAAKVEIIIALAGSQLRGP